MISAYPNTMLPVPQVARCNWWVVTGAKLSVDRPKHCSQRTGLLPPYLTCSEISFVLPVSSSHSAIKSSPKNALSGFLTPLFSSPAGYCCALSALRYHLRTSKARLSGSGSEAGATRIEGCSHQVAGNSTADFWARRKGGAVIFERSPLMVDIEARNCFNADLFSKIDDISPDSVQERKTWC